MVKVCQAYFITNDDEVYDQSIDRRLLVQNASINEELGQVEFIFSDKTGTLTCNKMEFKYCIIGNNIYGEKN